MNMNFFVFLEKCKFFYFYVLYFIDNICFFFEVCNRELNNFVLKSNVLCFFKDKFVDNCLFGL